MEYSGEFVGNIKYIRSRGEIPRYWHLCDCRICYKIGRRKWMYPWTKQNKKRRVKPPWRV